MKAFILVLAFCTIAFKGVIAQTKHVDVITTDIDNFWAAYDKITATQDSAEQYAYLNQLFISKGTPALKAIMQVRNYTSKSYINAINSYPLFWRSIRANMFKANGFANEINDGALKLKKLYPALKPAKVYFTVGAFRTGGTTLDSMVLIGSEIALADEHTITSEFTKSQPNLIAHYKTNPINTVVFTNVHEYVHTQQKTTIGNTLLAQCVLEGVAEFMAVKATGQQSPLPAINYGKTHDDRIKAVFSSRLFNPDYGFWLYDDAKNEFGMRDLGYYVGYAICGQYYNQAKNKKQAIKEMIELDYNNEAALSQFVDASGYLNKPVRVLKSEYEERRPTVIGIKPFANHATNVNASITQFTMEFSVPMNKRLRGFELGPLGKSALLIVKRFVSFADDGRTATFEMELKPNRHYQIEVNKFYDTNGAKLKPYIIDFKTGGQ